jgi:hypothetical protein
VVTEARNDEYLMMQAHKREPQVLGSWKEIAAYLGKGVRTVQRWENDLGLPVRRPNGTAKGVVNALPNELDRWLALQWKRRSIVPVTESGPHEDLRAAVRTLTELHFAHRQLIEELVQSLKSVRQQCADLAETTNRSKQMRKARTERE